MPHVASETNALLHRHARFPAPAVSAAKESATPFAALLDPPAAQPDPAPACEREQAQPNNRAACPARSDAPAPQPDNARSETGETAREAAKEESPACDQKTPEEKIAAESVIPDFTPAAPENTDAPVEAAAPVAAANVAAAMAAPVMPAATEIAPVESAPVESAPVVAPAAAAAAAAAAIEIAPASAAPAAETAALETGHAASAAAPKVAPPVAKRPDDAAADEGSLPAPAESAETPPQHLEAAKPAAPRQANADQKPQSDIADIAAKPRESEPDAPGVTERAAGETAPQAKTVPHPLQSFILPASASHASAAASAAAPQMAASAVPLAGLAVEIATQARGGNKSFAIRLDPPELGRIDVRLDVDRHGQVTSRLVVERVETLDLLRRDAAGLERALQDAGLKTGDNTLQFSLRDQTPGREQTPRDAGRHHAQLIIPEEDGAGEQSGLRLLGLGGGLDIRV